MLPTIPWKIVGVGALVLAIITSMIGLIRYGQKLGRAEAEIAALEQELLDLENWKTDAIEKMERQSESIAAWTEAATRFETDYLDAISRPPEIITRWRETAVEVPVNVQLGDCDRAATNAWDVLLQAGLIGERTWQDTSYRSPSYWSSVLAAARLDAQLRPPSLNMYLSPFPSPLVNGYAGTYRISPSPIFSETP